MWIRRAEYADLLARANRAEATAAVVYEAEAITRRREGERAAELRDARREIKRLTDVIIQLKERGQELRPEYTDERWGSYAMDDVEKELVERPAVSRSRAPTPDEADVAELEKELRAAVGEALLD